MTNPRSWIAPDGTRGTFHVISRCTRRQWLLNGEHAHRKAWNCALTAELLEVDLHAWAVMAEPGRFQSAAVGGAEARRAYAESCGRKWIADKTPIWLGEEWGSLSKDKCDLSFLHYHRYSVADITKQNGSVIERYAYKAYGEWVVLDASGNEKVDQTPLQPYGYTGRRYDGETGMWFFRARYFDGELGRFISRDPLGYVDGWSMYRGYFVPGYLDPSGTERVQVSGTFWFHHTNPQLDDLGYPVTDAAGENNGRLELYYKFFVNMECRGSSCLPFIAREDDVETTMTTYNAQGRPMLAIHNPVIVVLPNTGIMKLPLMAGQFNTLNISESSDQSSVEDLECPSGHIKKGSAHRLLDITWSRTTWIGVPRKVGRIGVDGFFRNTVNTVLSRSRHLVRLTCCCDPSGESCYPITSEERVSTDTGYGDDGYWRKPLPDGGL